MNRIKSLLIQTLSVLAFSLLLLPACASRFRQDLYLTGEGPQKRVKIEQTSLVRQADLGDPTARLKYQPGDHNIAVLTISTRRARPESGASAWEFSFDESWRANVYLQLAEPIRAGRYTLQGNSFAILLEQYQLTSDQRVFHALTGEFVVDSISSRDAFLHINGKYANGKQEPMNLEGNFKVKIRE